MPFTFPGPSKNDPERNCAACNSFDGWRPGPVGT